MKTTDLIISIALLACILTPAYVLYFLKYQLFANQKRHKSIIDSISTDLSKLHYEVEKIQFDEVENRLERNKQLLELTEKIDSSHRKHSMTQNNIDNMNVTLDYLRRTFNDDMSKVNERFELQSALHTAFEAKLEDSLEKSISKLDKKYDIDYVMTALNILQIDVDGLQSLNITTQQILNRINSKEFAMEVIYAWVNKIQKEKLSEQNEVKAPSKPKRGRPSSKKNEPNESISEQEPTLNIIENKQEQEQDIEVKPKKPRAPKNNARRKISMQEVESAFKEKTGLTYRGYVLKYGQEEFLKKKGNIYDSVYYQKFTKPKQQELAKNQ